MKTKSNTLNVNKIVIALLYDDLIDGGVFLFSLYLVIGALTGVLSGLLGIGGGIIVVPSLAVIFGRSATVPVGYAMHMAIGTSLAIMVFTTASGLYSHNRYGTIRWDIIKIIMPALIVGAIAGAILAQFTPSFYLRILFGVFTLAMGFRMMRNKPQVSSDNDFSPFIMRLISTLVGILSSLLGAGGGALLVPFLLRCQLDMRAATGTSLVGASMIALVASLSFLVTAFFTKNVPGSTGFIYWPAFLGIVFVSILFAPIGAMLAHRLPVSFLKRIFAVFLLLIAIDMLFFSK